LLQRRRGSQGREATEAGPGIDHRDVVAQLGDPDREPAGAAADVEDPELLHRLVAVAA
jgi:hypothetical protein